jgi:hypothetical protein
LARQQNFDLWDNFRRRRLGCRRLTDWFWLWFWLWFGLWFGCRLWRWCRHDRRDHGLWFRHDRANNSETRKVCMKKELENKQSTK